MVVYKEPAPVSRQHLLRMAMLSQRAVDCATKAYELQDVRFCLQLKTVDHAYRTLPELAWDSGNPHGTESCVLQIYKGLRGTFGAAMEIVESVTLCLQDVLTSKSSSPRWVCAARFANSLVSLNTVALFKGQGVLANSVVAAKALWEQEIQPSPEDDRISEASVVRIEKCIARCLNVIVGQSIDIASLLVHRSEEICREKLFGNGYAVRLSTERTRAKTYHLTLQPAEGA
jgi:hypothetical protein